MPGELALSGDPPAEVVVLASDGDVGAATTGAAGAAGGAAEGLNGLRGGPAEELLLLGTGLGPAEEPGEPHGPSEEGELRASHAHGHEEGKHEELFHVHLGSHD